MICIFNIVYLSAISYWYCKHILYICILQVVYTDRCIQKKKLYFFTLYKYWGLCSSWVSLPSKHISHGTVSVCLCIFYLWCEVPGCVSLLVQMTLICKCTTCKYSSAFPPKIPGIHIFKELMPVRFKQISMLTYQNYSITFQLIVGPSFVKSPKQLHVNYYWPQTTSKAICFHL